MNIRTHLPLLLLVASCAIFGGVVGCGDETVVNRVSSDPLQADRMAVPGVNTALIASSRKDDFNMGDPSTDVANFETEMETNVTNLRSAVTATLGAETSGPLGNLTVAQMVDIVNPDIVGVDFSSAVNFPNGRDLTDDVMDAVLGVVLNRGGGSGIADTIGANDVSFSGTFPYLAAPN